MDPPVYADLGRVAVYLGLVGHRTVVEVVFVGVMQLPPNVVEDVVHPGQDHLKKT